MARLWKAALTGAAALGLPAVLNGRIAASTRRLESALQGEARYYPWDHGYVFHVGGGEGPPIVLAHGVYPGASSFEWRESFRRLTASHRVFALDLLGFGLSDRPALTYDPPLYETLLGDFVQDVVGEPALLCATSLSGAFAVHAAFQRPAAFSGLILVGPAGVYDWDRPPGIANFLLHRALRFPVLGLSGYYGLTSRAALERWLRSRLYHRPESVTPAVVKAHHTAAHQTGASYAVAAFLAGLLNEPVEGLFGELRVPVLLAWGRHSRLAPVENAGGFLALNPDVELEIFEASGALPQVEEPERFCDAVATWSARAAAAPAR